MVVIFTIAIIETREKPGLPGKRRIYYYKGKFLRNLKEKEK